LILYVNGDSHSAGAEAVNDHAFAEDDSLYWGLGRQPHPDNLRASYGCELANLMGAILECDAESAASNDRIFRTTWNHLQGVQNMPVSRPDYIVIGWTTWEREEWTHEGQTYQVTASGTDSVPKALETKYKEWVIEQSDPEVRHEKIKDVHNKIWALHNDLNRRSIPHLFFNTYSDFNTIKQLGIETYDWGQSYLRPYDIDGTYYNWCLANGFKTANPGSYHFRADAHAAWAEYLYQNIVQKALTS
jgi:hypothetical protein